MHFKLNLLLFIFLPLVVFGQDLIVTPMTSLSAEISETSGLLMVEGTLVTHNDSGDGSFLYEVDPETGMVTRTVVVANAAAQDWEDICKDGSYIYLGDFGNNDGVRTNLRIFRVSILDYISTPNDTVYADTIRFNYADQVDFEPATYTTNYDAEAMIAYNDSLYIFTKNWGNYKTNIYAVPKTPGEYSVSIVDSLNTEGLVTGASFDPVHAEILLCGYTFTTPFLYLLDDVEGVNFSAFPQMRYTPGIVESIQVEGVATLGLHHYYISSEDHVTGSSYLHQLSLSGFSTVPETDNIVYYTKTHSGIMLMDSQLSVRLFDFNGRLVYEKMGISHDFSHLEGGSFILVIRNEQKVVIRERIFVK